MIDKRLDGVFIHVSNIAKSAAWYSRLLNLPDGKAAHEGMTYNLPIDGSTQVMLDGYPKSVSARGTGPRVMFTTSDLTQARDLALTLSNTVSEVQDIGSSLVFYLEDPDGNLICIRQPKEDVG